MVTETTKKLREPIAIGLLAVAVLYFVSGLSLLFKSRNDIGFGFAGRAALDGHVFADPIVVISLAVAVLLVISWGEPSRNARTIVLAASVIGALCLVFAAVSWVASLTSEEVSAYGGVNGAGRIVGIFLGLAQLSFLGLAVTYAAMVFQSFPKPVRTTQQWGQQQQQWGQQQWGQQPQWQQQEWGQQPPQQQQAWGQQPQPWGQPQQQQTWSEPQQQWVQPQQHSWGEAPGNTPPPGSGWGSTAAAPPVHSSWGQTPDQSGWTRAEEPTPSAWSAPETSQATPAHAAWSEPEQPDPTPVSPAAADDDGAVDIASGSSTTDEPWNSAPAADADPDISQDDVTDGDADAGGSGSEGTPESDSGWWRPSST